MLSGWRGRNVSSTGRQELSVCPRVKTCLSALRLLLAEALVSQTVGDRVEAELIVRCGVAFILGALSCPTSLCCCSHVWNFRQRVCRRSPREHAHDLQLTVHSSLHLTVIFYGWDFLSFKPVTESPFSLKHWEFPFKCGKKKERCRI